jgi:DNA-binding response OmpR family regulator
MKRTILIADDDSAVRWMLCRLLSGENYRVLTARDGEEALAKCSAVRLDLVLLDLSLPLKSGWEILQRLNAENPRVPVIIITARPNQIFPALASGVGALMEKPLDLPKLLRTIRELMAEPAASVLARAEGRPAEFHYLPPRLKHSV